MEGETVDIFKKIYNVIHSCTTEAQLEVANRYLKLAEKNGYIPQEFGVAIYYNIYLDKANELMA